MFFHKILLTTLAVVSALVYLTALDLWQYHLRNEAAQVANGVVKSHGKLHHTLNWCLCTGHKYRKLVWIKVLVTIALIWIFHDAHMRSFHI